MRYRRDMESKMITKREAAVILGVSLATVDRLIRDGTLTPKKYGDLPQSPVRLRETQVRAVKRSRPPAPPARKRKAS